MNMAKTANLKSTVERGRPRKRAEQQRSVETRSAILDAAIAEFAERGFEGASIRAIADRLGLQHPLITYHYRSKDILWRAAAEHAFAQIRAGWDTSAPENSDLPPLARLREEYATLFRYTVAFPEFHRFMRQEAMSGSPRLKWVAETVLTPLLGRLIPQIVAAQKQGLLPAVDPILFSPPRSRGSGLKCGLRADYPPRTRRSWKRIGAWWTKWSLEHMRAGSLIG